jgi:regulator of replication initiation timing
MIYYSQRDPLWANDSLGSTRIGTHGCLVTALAQLLLINGYQETPKTVNQKLKSVNGFSGPNNNLLIWGAIEKVFNAKGYWTTQPFNNGVVLNTIEKYGGCLVRVDGSRIGATQHWVLYIGKGEMIDPWTGVKKATSYYPATGYSVIEVERKEEDMSFLETDIPSDVEERFKLKEVDRYDKYWSYSELITDWVKLVGEYNYEKTEKEKYKKEARESRTIIKSQAEEIQKLKKEVESLCKDKNSLELENQQLKVLYGEISIERDSLITIRDDYSKSLNKCLETKKDLEDKLLTLNPLGDYPIKDLLGEIFDRIFKKGV